MPRRFFLPTLLIAFVLALAVSPGVRAQGQTYSLWNDTTYPADVSTYGAIEVGVRFTSSLAGQITAIRFYMPPLHTGTHTVNLWTADGTLLASEAYSGDSSEGWKTVTLSTPVSILADTVYVASYLCSTGQIPITQSFFTSPVTNGPLTAPSGNNGVYTEGGGFPTSSYSDTNYWADVVFQEAQVTETPTVTVTPTETTLPATETPTPTQSIQFTATPAPGVVSTFVLNSGNVLLIERRVTFGEIADAITNLLVVVSIALVAILFIPRMYLR